MTDKPDPPKVEPAKDDDKGAATPPPPAADKGDDLKRLRSELDGLHKQAGEQKARADKAEAALAKIEADKKKALEAELAEQGKHKEIIEEREKRITELENELKSTKLAAVISEARSKLGDVRSKKARERLAEEWAALDEKERADEKAWDTWLEQQKADDPEAFASPSTPVTPTRAGSPPSPGSTGPSLPERLVAKDERGYPDLETQSAAIQEAKERLARGEPIQ